MIIDYVLLTGLVTVLVVAVYVALIRRPQTRVRSNADGGPSKAGRIHRRTIPGIVARRGFDAGIVGRRSRRRLITAARLSSFARRPVSRRRNDDS